MYTIILFPALDVLSVFPLQAINLSDNLISLTYGNFDSEKISTTVFVIYRLAVIIVPLSIAAFFYSLGYILDFVGTISLLGAGVFIPLMTISSRKIIPQHGDYDSWFSSDGWSWCMLISTILIFIAIWVLLLLWISVND